MAKEAPQPKQIPFAFNNADSDTSALELVYMVYPDWKTDPGLVDIVRFTGGIMNTVGRPLDLHLPDD
jgi:ethanolamine kinase